MEEEKMDKLASLYFKRDCAREVIKKQDNTLHGHLMIETMEYFLFQIEVEIMCYESCIIIE